MVKLKDGVAAIAARRVDDAVGMDRAGDRIGRQAGGFPHELSGRQIVAAHAVRRRRDHLRPAIVLDDHRRRPTRRFVGFVSP